ncbi:MAG: DUF2339 domain-containing protein [Candidatus Latescibacteria bacterium]|nr:DUF2339 domain-containing protein [Candidatus Latescibacterota bacterium]
MTEHEGMSPQERIEKLERAVKELQQTVKRLTEMSTQHDIDQPEKLQDTISAETIHGNIPAVGVTEAVTVDDNMKLCPFCQKQIRKQAIKCRYCHKMIEPVSAPENISVAVTPIEEKRAKELETPDKPSRTREEWEAFIGGKLLNRVGALALIIGCGFFLKYAFDNNWINETMRVLIGVAVGVSLLIGGARFHKKGLSIFVQGLVGAGIPILYLSVYASFNFYQLIPQAIAFILMSCVTIIAFQQAVRYDSFAVSLLGWFGGFLTPFLLSTGEVNSVGLFTYIVLLDAGLLAVLYVKEKWAILEPLTLGATYLVYLLWYKEFYTIGNFAIAVVFLTLFWGLFHAFDIMRMLKPVSSFSQLRQFVPVLNTVVYSLPMYAVIDHEYPDWTAPVFLLIGGVYFLTFLWSLNRHVGDEKISTRNALTSIVLLVIATALQYSGFTLVIALSVEVLVIAWCGTYFKLNYIWQAALGVCVLATLRLLSIEESWFYAQNEAFRLILNRRFLTFAVLAATYGGLVNLTRHVEDTYKTKIQAALHYGWCILLFLLITLETYDFTGQNLEVMLMCVLAIVWIIYALPVILFGIKNNVPALLHCGLAVSILALMASVANGITVYNPIREFLPVINVRAVSMLVVAAGIFLVELWVRKSPEHISWKRYVTGICQIAVVLLVFLLLTAETRDVFEKAIVNIPQGVGSTGNLDNLKNQQQLSLSGVWLLYSIILIVIGMLRKIQGLRIMSIALFGITILKIFIFDLSFLGQPYRIFSFIGLGIILLAVSYVYQQYKDIIFEKRVER